jgi:hypothetical protein
VSRDLSANSRNDAPRISDDRSRTMCPRTNVDQELKVWLLNLCDPSRIAAALREKA